MLAVFMSALGCISSCVNRTEKEYDYSDFEDCFISWENALNCAESQYFVYIFSKTCHACKEIKNDVLNYAAREKYSFYFVEYSNEIPSGEDIDQTIGAKYIKDVYIRGIPSLLEIENGQVALNIAGTTEILKFLNRISYANI